MKMVFKKKAMSETYIIVLFVLQFVNTMANVTTVTFNNGHKYPALGLGTWKSEAGQVTQAVKDAIDLGYRHFDCAHIYGNEKEIGYGISAKISDGVIKREDLFITSKVWNTYHRPAAVEPALRVTLRNLNVTYLDLYLIHWPMGFKEGDDLFPLGPDGKVLPSDYDYVDTWKAIEEIHKKGLAKSIGISNFNKAQIERLLKFAEVVPVVNQVECSPFLNQKKLSEFCESKNIKIIAYSPLGHADPQLLEDPKLKELAKKYKKTVAQLVLRYQIQRGHLVIPKSSKKSRIAENIDIFDFNLSADDMKYLNSIDRNARTIKFEETQEHKYYPFNDEY